MNAIRNLVFWWKASRPKTLTASLSPILLGLAIAYRDMNLTQSNFKFTIAIITLCVAILIQIGTNYANDYFDALKGSDTTKRKGPKRLSQNKNITLKDIKKAFIICFATAFIFGLVLVYHKGWIILAVGILSIIAGIGYTATPYALAYHGLGDLFVLIFLGPVALTVSYFLQTGTASVPIIWIGIASGLYSVAILVVNNIRDIEEDRLSNKKTLAVRWGLLFSKIEYMLCLIVPSIIILIICNYNPNYMGLCLGLFTLIFIPNLYKKIQTKTGTELNLLLEKTGKTGFIFSILSSIGLWII